MSFKIHDFGTMMWQPYVPSTNKIISMQFLMALVSDFGYLWISHLQDMNTMGEHSGPLPTDVSSKVSFSFMESNQLSNEIILLFLPFPGFYTTTNENSHHFHISIILGKRGEYNGMEEDAELKKSLSFPK